MRFGIDNPEKVLNGRSVNELLDEIRQERALEDARQVALAYHPTAAEAPALVSNAEHQFAERSKEAAALLEQLETVQLQRAELTPDLDAAEFELAEHQREQARRVQDEQAAMRAGEMPHTVDVELLEAGQKAILERRRDFQRQLHAERDAPLAERQEELERQLQIAQTRQRDAAFELEYAKLIASAAPVLERVLALADQVKALEGIASTGVRNGTAHRELRRWKEQVARELLPVLPEGVRGVLGPAPRRQHAKPVAPLRDPIEVVVRDKMQLGTAKGGEHVLIERADLESKAIASTVYTLEQAAQLAHAKEEAARKRDPSAVARISNMITTQLADLTRRAQAGAAEKEAKAAKQREVDEGLLRLAEHVAHHGGVGE